MPIILLDDSIHASERMSILQKWQPEHAKSIRDIVGLTPDLVLIDEGVTPETAQELMTWGLPVCLVTTRVSIAVRRRFPMVKDMVTNEQLQNYVQRHMSETEDPSMDTTGPQSTEQVDPEMTPKADAEQVESMTVSVPATSPVVYTTITHDEDDSILRRAKIVGFVSLRSHGGGAGKTGVCYNYASYAAKQGRKVLLVDMDPNGPLGVLSSIESDLSTEHWCNLMQQYQGKPMTERAVFDNIECQHPYGFYIIPAPSKESMISKEQFKWILTQVHSFFDLIIFDMPATWTITTIEMMRQADELILFGQYDPIQYLEYKRSIEKITNPLVVGLSRERLNVVLGRAYIGKNREIELEEVRKQLGVEQVIIIPEDPAFQQFRNDHKAIVVEKPSAHCAKAMLPWMQQQVNALSVKSNLPVPYAPSNKRGFLARLFGMKQTKAVVHK